MSDLSPRDFTSYFEAVHHHPPFPWQARLLAQVEKQGRWPSLLDLPTGTGKTAAIDIAVFHLALDATRPVAGRRAPRRIVMVVDRRTVVDQAFERALVISNALSNATNGVLRVVRDRLCTLSGTETALDRAQLRGGMPRDDTWARTPSQPLVAVSTVDQVGSRLLFRGYGVSNSMRPIHAGLLGHDTLFLLDEVHLSQPFLETLDSIQQYRQWSKSTLPDRWQYVAMSATPGKQQASFGLEDTDRQNERLAQRLAASKPFKRSEVKVSGTDTARRTKFANECCDRVKAFAKPGRTVGVVVNRVATAVEVHRLVKDCLPEALTFLVTGRMRPLERTDLDRQISVLVRSGRERNPDAKPIVVVATQCIEAGADYDFDALVTECASLDALRQRFGRLNRLGEIDDAEGVVLIQSSALGKDQKDPVYGSALANTWQWLERAPSDFGIQAMEARLPKGDELLAMLPEPSRAPVMLPAHLDAWTQTTPIPRPDPDVSLWLHGVDQRRDADVQLVWRADITEASLVAADAEEEGAIDALLARMDICPPTNLEALAVPIAAARAWLSGLVAIEVADVERSFAEENDKERSAIPPTTRPALLWKGDDSQIIQPSELRAGMTIVVPSSYGGLEDGAWVPSSPTPVSDLGDRARWQQTGRPMLRLHPSLVGAPPKPVDPDSVDDNDHDLVSTWLNAHSPASTLSWFDEVVSALRSSKQKRNVVRLDATASLDGAQNQDDTYLAVVGRSRIRDVCRTEATTEDDRASRSSHTGVEVTLDEHMIGVKSWAGRFATQCGLPIEIVTDLEIAGRWHDAGKVDPRFQRLLRGGSPLADVGSEPLAKSKMVSADRATLMRARERSLYPKGGRHELSSVSLLEKEPRLLFEASDRDLVLHLVAAHHGWCRPFAPVTEDNEPVDLRLRTDEGDVVVSSVHGLASLDSGVAERFWRLVERYGWFGLAWLEAILRLADHRRSEEEQNSVQVGS